MCVGVLINMYTVLWLRFFLTWLKFFLLWLRFFRTFSSVVKAKLAKTGHGPHSPTLVVICVVRLLFVLFYVLFVCKCLLTPGDNPIAVNKYIISYIITAPMGRTACTEPQCLYKGALYLFLPLQGVQETNRCITGSKVMVHFLHHWHIAKCSNYISYSTRTVLQCTPVAVLLLLHSSGRTWQHDCLVHLVSNKVMTPG